MLYFLELLSFIIAVVTQSSAPPHSVLLINVATPGIKQDLRLKVQLKYNLFNCSNIMCSIMNIKNIYVSVYI